MGAVARAASNFGFLHLRVVEPYEAAYREARSAVSGAELLSRAVEFSSVADAVGDCSLVVGTTAGSRRELHHKLLRLEDGARLIRRRLRSGRVAILFGSEKTGLSNRDFSHCHWLMRIPTREGHASMNLGQAAAICLYELARERGQKERPEKELLANGNELERTTSTLLEALRVSGYLNGWTSHVAEEKLRRLVRRMNLSPEDNEVWLGMLRKMAWAIRRVKPPQGDF